MNIAFFYSLLTCSYFVVMAGCQSRKTTSATVADTVSEFGVNPKPSSCNIGETPQMFSLKSVPGIGAELGQRKLLMDVDNSLFKEGEEGREDSKNLRIDLCASENFDKFRIVNIFVNTKDKGLVTLSSASAEITTQGLDSFQFSTEEKLSIQAKNSDGVRFDLETVPAIVTDPKADGAEFLPKLKTLATLRTLDTMVVLSAVSGVMTGGNPFSLCGIDGEQSEAFSEFSLGTAKFKFDLCLGAGESQGIHYLVKRISVQDSNPSLMTDEKKEFVLESKDLVSPNFVTSLHHHNSCDSFKLVFPHATYFATAATLQGEDSCGKVVEGAIQLKNNGKVGAFKVIYKTDTVTNLNGGFVHYLVDTLVRL